MAKIDHTSVAVVMAHVVRCPAVAAQFQATGVVGSDFLRTPFEYCAAVVDALWEYRTARGDEPSYPVMELLCARITISHPALQRYVPRIRAFLRFAYGAFKAEDLRPLFFTESGGVMQQVIDEVKIAPLTRQLGLEHDPARRDTLLQDLHDVRARTRITTARHIDLFEPAVLARLTASMGRRETGVDFLDKALKGGIEKMALEGLIAGTGGGKTMFSVMRACESVLRGRNTVFFQYEQSVEGDLSTRLFSYATGASREELEGGYEKCSPEIRQRVADVAPLYKRHFRLFGMAGDTENQGIGGVEEIKAILRHMEQRDNWHADLVVVDWLGPLQSSWVKGKPRLKDKREEFMFIIAKLKELIASQNTDVLLLHQIAPGAMEKLSPHMHPDKTMAEEIKSFSNLMQYCYAFGKLCPESQCMWFVVSKARTTKVTSRIVRMNAERNRIEDAHGLYVINEEYRFGGGHAFIKRSGKQED